MSIRKSEAGPNSTATTSTSKITDKDVKSENSSQSLVADNQNLFDGEDISGHYNPNDCQNTKRNSIRFRPNGIVVLTSFEKPVVTNIYDIAPGGVSFLHANERDITSSEFKMDILIFDAQTDFEYFIGQVKGRVKSRELVTDPRSNEPIWLFVVEFVDLDSLKQSFLQTFCCLERTTNVLFQSERVPKISYDS